MEKMFYWFKSSVLTKQQPVARTRIIQSSRLFFSKHIKPQKVKTWQRVTIHDCVSDDCRSWNPNSRTSLLSECVRVCVCFWHHFWCVPSPTHLLFNKKKTPHMLFRRHMCTGAHIQTHSFQTALRFFYSLAVHWVGGKKTHLLVPDNNNLLKCNKT